MHLVPQHLAILLTLTFLHFVTFFNVYGPGAWVLAWYRVDMLYCCDEYNVAHICTARVCGSKFFMGGGGTTKLKKKNSRKFANF